MRARNDKEAQRGYSVIEALVSAALLGAIAAALSPALYTAVRSASHSRTLAEIAEQNRTARAVLASLFSAAVIPDQGSDEIWFEGRRDRIRMTVMFDAADDPQSATLSIQDGALRIQLRDDVIIYDGKEGVSIEEALAVNSALRFLYYADRNETNAGEWRSDWLDRTDLPALLRIESSGAADGALRVLDFRLPARGPIRCDFDQVTRRCR